MTGSAAGRAGVTTGEAFLASTDSIAAVSLLSDGSMVSSSSIKFIRNASACEDHPAVQGGGTAPAATAGRDAGGGGYAVDDGAKTNLLVAYESWQAHPVRFVLASVLRVVFSLLHQSSPFRMGCQKDFVGCPRIQQRGCHRASPPCMGVHEGPAQLGSGRSGKFRPHQGDRTSHKRR